MENKELFNICRSIMFFINKITLFFLDIKFLIAEQLNEIF